MENRKLIIPIILLVMGLFFVAHKSARAYNTDTHELLTQEVVKLYEKKNSSLETVLTPFLIDGSRREDDSPRWMNHFYDPVKNRGLSYDAAIDPWYILGDWESSKQWAQDDSNQNKLTYSPIIASILSLVETGKIQPFINSSDFTWKQAQKYWIQGNKEMALFTLGHVIHLIEDASVPDHTRNDPHPGDSPYETYTSQYTAKNPDTLLKIRLANTTAIQKNSLSEYFDGIASYSNNNFYSKDTIGIQSGYNEPQMDPLNYINGSKYIVRNDEGGNKYILALVTANKGSILMTGQRTISIEDASVDKSYWSLLSKKSVQYGAGVLELFFKEVEQHKNDPEYLAKEKPSLLAQVASFTQNTIQTIRNTISGAFGGGGSAPTQNNVQEIPLVQQTTGNQKQIVVNQIENKKPAPVDSEITDPTPPQQIQLPEKIIQPTTATITPTVATTTPTTTKQTQPKIQSPAKTTQTPVTKECSIPVYKNATRGPIVFNEIAWMGTSKSSSNEWIELKNNDYYAISLEGWTLRNASKSINVQLSESKTKSLNPKDLFLLERTDNTSAPAASNLIYTGALKNTGEELFLFDSFCNLIDYVAAQPSWPAGDSTDHRTMERDVTGFGWHTSSVINGTPKKENSTPYIAPEKNTPSTTQNPTNSNTTSNSSHTSNSNTSNNSNNTNQTQDYPPAPPQHTIVINEIMYNPVGADADHEWIELYNSGTSTISLVEPWKLRENETNHTITPYKGGNNIAPNSFAIITQDGIVFEQDHPTTTVPLFTASFSLSNSGEAVSLQYNNTDIDTATYASSTGADGDGNSLQYIGGVWTASIPTPGEVNVFSLQNTTSSTSTSQENATPTPSDTATSTNTTATSTATSTDSSPDEEVNHLVISEIYPDKTGANADFVELYNPTTQDISLELYSLRIQNQDATSSSSLIDFTGEARSTIYAHGFYLVGLDNYADNTMVADAHRGASLPSTQSATISLQLTQGTSTEVIDETMYDPQQLQNNESFERQALTQGACTDPSGDNELSGNACDTNASRDFVIRSQKKPQNTNSLLEPRALPHSVSQLSGVYNKNKVSVELTWTDEQNDPTLTHYRIYEILPDTTKSFIASTTNTTSSVRIVTLGKDHTFTVSAADIEEYESTTTPVTINIPSFVSDIHFYNTQNPTIDVFYDSYPFIPSLHPEWTGDVGARMMVAYLNSGPYDPPYIQRTPLEPESAWPQEALDNMYPFKYLNSKGSNTYRYVYLRDTSKYPDMSLSFGYIGVNKLTLGSWLEKVPPLDENSYLTFAFYDESYDNTQFKQYQLTAVDETKYYFTPQDPSQTPTMTLLSSPQDETGTSTPQIDTVNETSSTTPETASTTASTTP